METTEVRQLRRNMTPAERKLWHFLRKRRRMGFKFRRQHRIGEYVVDFVCLETRLVVELDRRQHRERLSADRNRDLYIQARGYRVLRFWNRDLETNPQALLCCIDEALRNTPQWPARTG